uniref:Uncharacterized protein n=1 Tax=Ditylenchus dipsaci TaxID=166011 RepID=A0A915CSP0_9BILA
MIKKNYVLKSLGVSCLAVAGGSGLAFALLSFPISAPVSAVEIVGGCAAAIGQADVQVVNKKFVMKALGATCVAMAASGGFAFMLLSLTVSAPVVAITIIGGGTTLCLGGIAVGACLKK